MATCGDQELEKELEFNPDSKTSSFFLVKWKDYLKKPPVDYLPFEYREFILFFKKKEKDHIFYKTNIFSSEIEMIKYITPLLDSYCTLEHNKSVGISLRKAWRERFLKINLEDRYKYVPNQ